MDIYLLRKDTKLGPYSEPRVRQMLRSGLITDQDMSWHADLTEWVPVGLIMGATPQSGETVSELGIASQTSERRRFRVTVGASFLLLVSAVVAVITQSLPEPLGSAVQNTDSPFQDVVTGLVFIALIVAYVGLVLMKRWGRTLFTTAFAVLTVSGLFTGPDVEAPMTSLLTELFSVSCGAILALAYLTNLFQEQSA